jgi:hypothetical protein
MCFFILLSSDHKLPGDPTDGFADRFSRFRLFRKRRGLERPQMEQAKAPLDNFNGTYDKRRPKTLPIGQHF